MNRNMGLLISIILAIVLAVYFSATDRSTVPPSSEASAPGQEVPTIIGVSLDKAGLAIKLPDDCGIYDPNIPEDTNYIHEPVIGTTVNQHTEIVLQYPGSTFTIDWFTIVSLLSFEVGDAEIESTRFQINNASGESSVYSYSEIAEKIVYNHDEVIVVDVSFTDRYDYREAMNKYISENSGTILPHAINETTDSIRSFADGTIIYKYDWMEPAFDYVIKHLTELITIV